MRNGTRPIANVFTLSTMAPIRVTQLLRQHRIRNAYYENGLPTLECWCGAQCKGFRWLDAGREYDDHLLAALQEVPA